MTLSFDIFWQAGQSIANPTGVDPLNGLERMVILASGASQSAARLVTYYNSIQPLANLFDGFYLAVGGGEVRTDLGIDEIPYPWAVSYELSGAVDHADPFRHRSA